MGLITYQSSDEAEPAPRVEGSGAVDSNQRMPMVQVGAKSSVDLPSVVIPVMGSSQFTSGNVPKNPYDVALPLNLITANTKMQTAVNAHILDDRDFNVTREVPLAEESIEVGLAVDGLCRRIGMKVEALDDKNATVDLNDVREHMRLDNSMTKALVKDELWRLAVWRATSEIMSNNNQTCILPNEIPVLLTAIENDGFLSQVLRRGQKMIDSLDIQGYEYTGPEAGVKVSYGDIWHTALPDRLIKKVGKVHYTYPIVDAAVWAALLRDNPERLLALHAGKTRNFKDQEKGAVGGNNTLHGWARTGLTARPPKSRNRPSTLKNRIVVTDTLAGMGMLGNKVLTNLDFYNHPSSDENDSQGAGPIVVLPGLPSSDLHYQLSVILSNGNSLSPNPKRSALYDDAINNVVRPYLLARCNLGLESGEFKAELPMDDIAPNELPRIREWAQRQSDTVGLNTSVGFPLITHIMERIDERAKEIYTKHYAQMAA